MSVDKWWVDERPKPKGSMMWWWWPLIFSSQNIIILLFCAHCSDDVSDALRRRERVFLRALSLILYFMRAAVQWARVFCARVRFCACSAPRNRSKMHALFFVHWQLGRHASPISYYLYFSSNEGEATKNQFCSFSCQFNAAVSQCGRQKME